MMPPLPLLRTFEAAARHQSFRQAAEELHVTPAAVSQQMRMLEAQLDVPLFRRKPRGIELTEAGRDLLAGVAPGLRRLVDAVHRLSPGGRKGPLRVSTPPSFALFWLMPRLPAFRSRYPDIDLRLLPEARLADLRQGEADLAVRFGPGRYAGMQAEHLMADSVFPACSPALLGGGPVPRRLADLLRYPLLHDDGVGGAEERMTWRGWVGGAVDTASHIHLPDAVAVMQAALLGQGIALVRESVAAYHLAQGALLRPLAEARPTDFAYWTVVPPERADDPRISAFVAWVREAAAGET